MKTLRALRALAAVLSAAAVAYACSGGEPTAPAVPSRIIVKDSTAPAPMLADSAFCRDGTGTWGSGTRC